jgi:type IV secretory pathway TraG/TraD family ATPase VirD4
MDWHINSVMAAAAASLAGIALSRILRPRVLETHKRGPRLIDVAAPRRFMRRRKPLAEQLTLAGVPIPPLDETKHFKLIGTTGTGKSTAIRELLATAIVRGDRVIFADPDASYLQRFYNRLRGDVVLNPFEPDAVKWDLFGEITNNYDIEQLVSGLIADTQDPSAREWRGYARTFLSALIRRCHETRWTDAANLWRLALVAPPEELRPLVAGTPAQPFLEVENARMFGSIRSVAGSALAALEYIQAQRAAPFSVRHWVRDGDRRSLLFVPYKASQIAALRSVIAAWLRLAIFEALSQTEGDHRLWFVIDELDALGAIDGLKDALARLRKFGGRCVLSFQSLSQVAATYGGDAPTILENCTNTLILRCSGGENGGTSQFASKLIGEREIIRRQISRGADRASGFSARSARRSRSITEQHVTETAVMPSELELLADMRGYLKLASANHWLKVSLGKRS